MTKGQGGLWRASKVHVVQEGFYDTTERALKDDACCLKGLRCDDWERKVERQREHNMMMRAAWKA